MNERRHLSPQRLLPFVAIALLGVGGAVFAATRVDKATGEAWYDASPLVASIRPAARPGLERALGVEHLEDLPLYDLALRYEPGAARFSLGEDVWFTNEMGAPLDDLVFRTYVDASPPASGPQVRLVSGSCPFDARCVIGAVGASAVRVRPGAPIAPGGHLHVKLALEGTLTPIDPSRTNMLAQGLEGMKSIFGGGGGGGDYGLLAVGDGIASFANFFPVLARRVDGAWETDETSKLGDLGSDAMANVRARLVVPADAKVAVAGVVTGEKPAPPAQDGTTMREVSVAAAAVRDFAFLFGSGLEVATRDVDGVQVRSYFLAADRVAGAKVLDVAAHALQAFERRFGAYPYADYDVSEASIVGGAGGVEFSGLVTAASMFYRPMSGAPKPPHSPSGAAPGPARVGAAPAASEDDLVAGLMSQLGALGVNLGGGAMTDGMLEFVVAHETAHQWWHGLVGSDSREHPYEDEALAQYSSIVYLEDRYGRARAEKDGAANVKMNFQTMRMLGKPDAPADRPVASFGSSVQYAGVIYGKAPYFFKAVREAIGDSAFFGAVRAYVAKYRFGVAPARALVDLFAATSEAKVRPLERRWLDEAHGEEDLGALDLSSMLGGMAGAGGAAGGADGAQLEQMMKALQGLTSTLPGGGGAGGGAPSPGGADVDVDALMKALGGQ